MMATLRRIVVAALLGALVGLGVVMALFGRRPRTRGAARIAADAEVLVPVAGPSPVPRRRSGARGLALGLACLLLLTGLAGLVYRSRDTLLGLPGSHGSDGAGQPLAVRSPPDTDAAPAPAPHAEMRAGAHTMPESKPELGGVASLSPSAPTISPAPSFDVLRVEPNGDTVVAGRAAPNATVELLVDGKPAATATTGADGHFTLTPPPLPTGSSAIGLRATDAGGHVSRAPASIAVAVAPGRDAKPLVALTAPDQPTVVLSQPDPPPAGAPARGLGQQALRDGRDRATRPAPRGSDVPAPHPDGGSGGSEAGAPAADARAGLRGRGQDTPDQVAPSQFAPSQVAPSQVAPSQVAPGRASPAAGSATPAEAPQLAGTAVAAPEPKVVSIDAQAGGRLFVTAQAAPGATVRLYLNDALIAPATVARDGTVTFAIGHGVKPGAYRVRVDLVDAATGKVRSRAEVPFSAPDPGHDDGVVSSAAREARTPDPAAAPSPGAAVAQRDRPADRADPPRASGTGALAASGPAKAPASAEVYVPGIDTARIVRGDSLWKISRRAYGAGERYTVIYDANQDQIRDPDLIYPGQIFVLPREDAAGAGLEERPR